MKKITLLLAFIIALCTLVSCGKAKTETIEETIEETTVETTAAQTMKEVEVDNPFGAFSTLDINGIGYDETVFAKNKLTLVNFCTTWCSPCASEMPSLGELAEKYEGKVGFIAIVLDINAQADPTDAVALAAKANNAFPFLLVSNSIMEGVGGSVTNIPATYFVDENGGILDGAYLGARSGEDWAEIIDGYLAEIN